MAGLLLSGLEGGDESRALGAVLDAGLKKISLKIPAAGMPAFANDWKLLLGAAVGIRQAVKLSCAGDWEAHRQYVLKAIEGLQRTDLNTAVMISFARKQFGEDQSVSTSVRSTAGLSLAELISVAWAHHVRLSLGIPEEECWAALQERLPGIRTEDLGFHELSLLLVVLKDNWATGWVINRTNGVDFVKATLREFLSCAKRDVKAGLIRSEADVQRIVWSILRPTFPDLVDEDYLPRFGAKNYKPDFGIPSLRLLIEVKYVGASKAIGEIQDELQADIIGYGESTSEYSSILFLVYDTRGEVAAHSGLHTAIREQPNVEDFIVVMGPAAPVEPKPRKTRA